MRTDRQISLDQGVMRDSEGAHLLLKGDDPRLNLFQGEVVHCFRRGVRQAGQVCAEIGEQLSRDDETDIFINHCKSAEDDSEISHLHQKNTTENVDDIYKKKN